MDHPLLLVPLPNEYHTDGQQGFPDGIILRRNLARDRHPAAGGVLAEEAIPQCRPAW